MVGDDTKNTGQKKKKKTMRKPKLVNIPMNHLQLILSYTTYCKIMISGFCRYTFAGPEEAQQEQEDG